MTPRTSSSPTWAGRSAPPWRRSPTPAPRPRGLAGTPGVPGAGTAQDLLRLLETILEWPRLHDLRFLSLAETRVGDAGLAHLQSLTSQQELHLDHTNITDEGLKLLASLPNLEILDLKGTRITDAGLAEVGRLTGLKGLYLTRTGITDAGLAHLRD